MKTLREIGRALLLGLVLSGAAAAAAFLIGLLARGPACGAEAMRSVLMLLCGFGLLYSAVLFVRGGNLPPSAFRLRPRRDDDDPGSDFALPRRLTLNMPGRYAALCASLPALLLSAAADALVRYLR